MCPKQSSNDAQRETIIASIITSTRVYSNGNLRHITEGKKPQIIRSDHYRMLLEVGKRHTHFSGYDNAKCDHIPEFLRDILRDAVIASDWKRIRSWRKSLHDIVPRSGGWKELSVQPIIHRRMEMFTAIFKCTSQTTILCGAIPTRLRNIPMVTIVHLQYADARSSKKLAFYCYITTRTPVSSDK